jgi:hypothetical protein
VLDQLLASLGAPASRIVFDHGVETFRSADGRWRVPHPLGELAAPRPTRTRSPPTTGCARGARHGGRARRRVGHLVSAAGTLGWRPLVERLYEDGATAGDALRLRFALDALEHHCARLAHAYVAVNGAARRLMTMFGSRELQVLSGQPEPYYELDACSRAPRARTRWCARSRGARSATTAWRTRADAPAAAAPRPPRGGAGARQPAHAARAARGAARELGRVRRVRSRRTAAACTT